MTRWHEVTVDGLVYSFRDEETARQFQAEVDGSLYGQATALHAEVRALWEAIVEESRLGRFVEWLERRMTEDRMPAMTEDLILQGRLLLLEDLRDLAVNFPEDESRQVADLVANGRMEEAAKMIVDRLQEAIVK